jgi:NADH:ubiquinone oxidoreductase subunit K
MLGYIGLNHFLAVSAGLFAIGVYGLLAKRNAISLLMAVELMFNSANLALVAFARFGYQGAFAHFIITIAAAEIAVAVAILLLIYRLRGTVWVDEIDLMRW